MFCNIFIDEMLAPFALRQVTVKQTQVMYKNMSHDTKAQTFEKTCWSNKLRLTVLVRKSYCLFWTDICVFPCIPGSYYRSHSCEARWVLSCWVESVQAQLERGERWLHTVVEAATCTVKKAKSKISHQLALMWHKQNGHVCQMSTAV